MNVIYEDNHILIVAKKAGEIVQGDKTGDTPLSDMAKAYVKEKYHRPGNVFVGVVHRLDRPVSGLVCFARTSKALSRLCAMFASHEQVRKTYWALVCKRPPQDEGTLVNWLTRDTRRNMAKAYDHEVPHSKKAVLDYRLLATTDRSFLLEVNLHTGRHHQIRCQLAHMGCIIKGDLKYGAPRSNPDGSISLHARRICMEHPVSHQLIDVIAPVPEEPVWQSVASHLS